MIYEARGIQADSIPIMTKIPPYPEPEITAITKCPMDSTIDEINYTPALRCSE
jgi:hypothetical protein